MISALNSKYIVFDWDNTLADTTSELKMGMDKSIQTLISLGHEVKTPLVDGYWKKPIIELLINIKYSDYKKYEQIYVECLTEMACKKVEIFDGVHCLLTLLKNHKKELYIISNKETEILKRQINISGLGHFFENISGLCVVTGICKPSPEVFSMTFGRKVSPMDVLLIGDSQIDRDTSRTYGCNFIYVDNNSKKQLYNEEEGLSIRSLLKIATMFFNH